MTVRDGIGWASLHAIAAKYATGIVNVIDAGIALACGNSLRVGIFGGLNVNATRGAGSRAQKAAYTFLQTRLISVKNMDAAVTGLKNELVLRDNFP